MIKNYIKILLVGLLLVAVAIQAKTPKVIFSDPTKKYSSEEVQSCL